MEVLKNTPIFSPSPEVDPSCGCHTEALAHTIHLVSFNRAMIAENKATTEPVGPLATRSL